MVVAATLPALVAAIPLGYLVLRLSQSDPERLIASLWRARTLELAANSLGLSVTVAVGCLLIGVPTAWAITRLKLPAPALWRALATLPLAIPSYVAAFAWVATWPGISGFWPTAAILTLACAPYVTLPVAAALTMADSRYADAARTLGANPARVLLRVTLPRIAPAAAAGALLAALYTLADFGAVSLLRYPTLTWGVHAAFEGSLDRVLAAALSAVLVALAFVFVAGEQLMRRRAARAVAATGAEPTLATAGARTRAAAIAGLVVTAALSIGIPLGALVIRLTLGVDRDLEWPRLAESTASTLGLGLAGAAIAVLLALPIATLAARYRSFVGGILESFAYLGHVVPGVVVGLSLVFFTLAVAPALYQTVFALVFAYGVLFLPKALGSSRSAIRNVPPALEDAARTLGLGRLATWWRVTARIAIPGIAAGGLLAAVTAMKELPATLMLRPIGIETLATELWQKTAIAAYGAATPYAIALVIVASIPAFFLARSGDRP
ncbi:iron ABC transporter permease [Pseudolysinimonas sp.]|uniref:ABC transporter permease n=1 Tax=Pseudolysinimonas sp. TaxID=2680009 RepID=UPI00286D323B|nr:iron ABC transporter permease [Pseudolysinimonas sp.]